MIVLLLLLMGLSASIASFYLKKSTVNGLDFHKMILNPYLYLGVGLYVFSALVNLYLLKRMPYSVVVSLGSLTYIWTLIIARYLFGEAVTKFKIMGILFILTGVCLISVV